MRDHRSQNAVVLFSVRMRAKWTDPQTFIAEGLGLYLEPDLDGKCGDPLFTYPFKKGFGPGLIIKM